MVKISKIRGLTVKARSEVAHCWATMHPDRWVGDAEPEEVFDAWFAMGNRSAGEVVEVLDALRAASVPDQHVPGVAEAVNDMWAKSEPASAGEDARPDPLDLIMLLTREYNRLSDQLCELTEEFDEFRQSSGQVDFADLAPGIGRLDPIQSDITINLNLNGANTQQRHLISEALADLVKVLPS